MLIHQILLFLTTFWCFTSESVPISNEVPSPPKITKIECLKYSAFLSWNTTGNTKITGYLIQFETNYNAGEWINYEFLTNLEDKQVRLYLNPYTNYTFRVIAKNDQLVSLPSEPSSVCQTAEDVPYKNPEDVYGRGNGPNNLVISWKPMPPSEHNSPGFYYIVSWKQEDIPNTEWKRKIIHEWEQHKLIIENLPKLKAFRISVEAHNSKGKSNGVLQEVIGYSDEDYPSEAPKHFRLVKVVDGRSAIFAWQAVDPKTINGNFKGYKIQAWNDKELKMRDAIIQPNVTTSLVDIFTPKSRFYVRISAFNGAYDGPPSTKIQINTPDDVYPDPPSIRIHRILNSLNKGPDLRVEIEPNNTRQNPGEKFYVSYRKKGIDTLEPWLITIEDNIETNSTTKADIIGLEYNTFYEVRVGVKQGKLETFSQIVMVDSGSPITTPPPTTSQIATTIAATINYSDDNKPDVPPEPQGSKPQNPISTKEPTKKQEESKPADKTSTGSTPWVIALIVILIFILIFIGIFMFIKKRRQPRNTSSKNYRMNDSNVRIGGNDNVRGMKIVPKPTEDVNLLPRKNDSSVKNGESNQNDVTDDVPVFDRNNVYNDTTTKS